ncbi:MAG: hypothetical protein WC878_07120 [Candidatus Paceibacterota bacterium]
MSYLQHQSKLFVVLLFTFCFLLFASSASAASSDAFSLTVTPPLFQLSIGPGESWSSTIKVLNNNPYDVDIYASALNFQVKDESGIGRFVPAETAATTSYSLAGWLNVQKEPIHIPAEKTGIVPFTLHVPENAEPGGHYGAILTGNQPAAREGSNVVNVSAAISTLFLVRVNGEMIEKGDIREFSLDKRWYQEPKVNFSLRFENKGNVHLLPRGEISIRNMWGKERGKILVNQESDFGNVLPKSIRKFSFEWSGEDNFFEIGRYTAVATLSFGGQEKETAYREISFWVVPLAPVFKIFAFLFVFIGLFAWSVRRYVRRALALETERMAVVQGSAPKKFEEVKQPRKEAFQPPAPEKMRVMPETLKVKTLVRPIALGVVDLRSAIGEKSAVAEKEGRYIGAAEHLTLSRFIRKYRIFFICLILILAGIYGVRAYFRQVLTRQRDYSVKVQREDGGIMQNPVNSQIKKDDIKLSP